MRITTKSRSFMRKSMQHILRWSMFASWSDVFVDIDWNQTQTFDMNASLSQILSFLPFNPCQSSPHEQQDGIHSGLCTSRWWAFYCNVCIATQLQSACLDPTIAHKLMLATNALHNGWSRQRSREIFWGICWRITTTAAPRLFHS